MASGSSTNSARSVSRPKIEYAIFDMDGLLSAFVRKWKNWVLHWLDSIPLGPRCHDMLLINASRFRDRILGRYGHEFTWEIKSGVMGKVAREACEYILSHYPDVLEKITVEEYMAERLAMHRAMFMEVPLMQGAAHLVQSLASRDISRDHCQGVHCGTAPQFSTGRHAQGVPIAVATGSTLANFKLKTGHLQDVFSLFPADSIITGDSPAVGPGRGKPCPDIFLAAARSLGRDVGTADLCSEAQKAERAKGVVFEDAVLGVRAGVSADMNVIWVPDENLRALAPDQDYGAAQVLESLTEWDPAAWGLQVFPPARRSE